MENLPEIQPTKSMMTGFLLKKNWAGLVKKRCRDELTLFNVLLPEYGGGQRPVIKEGNQIISKISLIIWIVLKTAF